MENFDYAPINTPNSDKYKGKHNREKVKMEVVSNIVKRGIAQAD